MSDAQLKKIDASQLSVGMFVAELDRPWLGTPFLLEGVLIEEQDEIDTFNELCEHVFVDLSLSVGSFDIASIDEEPVETKQTVTTQSINSSIRIEKNSAPQTDEFSFFNVLKEIKTSQRAQDVHNLNNIQSTSAAFIKKQHQYDDSIAGYDHLDADVKKQIKGEITGIVAGMSRGNANSDKLASHLAAKQMAKHNKELNPVEKEIVAVYPAFDKASIATKQIFESIASEKHIKLDNVHEALDGMVDSIERNPDALIWLTKLKQSDNEAYNHAMNVSVTIMALGNFMSLPKKQVKDLGMAGLLQDIGKAKIDTDLLHKTTKITPEEYEIFKSHVAHTIDMLQKTRNIPLNVVKTISQHHERIDGSGYPAQLAGKQVSLTGQLAGLVDTYCAITTDRAYAKGVYNQEALEEIHRYRDTKFSGVIIDQMVQFLGMYPVTTLVELNTGEVGVVIEQNSVRRLLPRVMILLNSDKTKNPSPTTLNLINAPQTPSGEPYAIVRGLPPNSYDLNPSNYYAE